MQFVVHGHHLELTESLKERCRLHIYERVEKLVDDSAARLEIELTDQFGAKSRSGDMGCRVDLRVPGLAPIHVDELRGNMHEAIDLAADRLVEALRRSIEKKEGARRRGGVRLAASAAGSPAEPEELD